jgi:hypothetical protein
MNSNYQKQGKLCRLFIQTLLHFKVRQLNYHQGREPYTPFYTKGRPGNRANMLQSVWANQHIAAFAKRKSLFRPRVLLFVFDLDLWIEMENST